MDELIAKLTNLGYEFFGVILPGIVTSIFGVLWWVALGAVVPFWSFGNVPQLGLRNWVEIVESLGLKTGLGLVVSARVQIYPGMRVEGLPRDVSRPVSGWHVGKCNASLVMARCARRMAVRLQAGEQAAQESRADLPARRPVRTARLFRLSCACSVPLP
jgi:hypothetical protein